MNTENDEDELREALPDEVTLYFVASAIDGDVYGPFIDYCAALAFAEPADGSMFECTARLIDVKEV